MPRLTEAEIKELERKHADIMSEGIPRLVTENGKNFFVVPPGTEYHCNKCGRDYVVNQIRKVCVDNGNFPHCSCGSKSMPDGKST